MQEPVVRVFEGIGEMLTLEGAARKNARRVQEADLSIIKDAVIVSQNGRVHWAGPRTQFSKEILKSAGGERAHEFADLGGRTVIPAFVEPHTHLVFAGDRAQEFEWRMQGQTYQEIAAKGGGILSTVKSTRQASEGDLLQLAQERADRFTAQGVTTLEVKSGYGLDLETELKCLRVARALKGPRIITTYLGPHSRSPDHPDLQTYMRFICDEVLPQIARDKLADRVDIYIEKGFYTLDLAQEYFSAVRKLGLPVTAHVEQLSDTGGTQLALEFQPQSVDHIVYINEQVTAKIAKSETTAVLLPASDFYLKMRYPPARSLIDAGAKVALSTDFNPGTSPTQDLSLVGVLARLEMKMSLAEVLSAMTLGSACALNQQSRVGSIEAKKDCDFVSLDCAWNELFYSVGRHPVHSVVKAGRELKSVKEK